MEYFIKHLQTRTAEGENFAVLDHMIKICHLELKLSRGEISVHGKLRKVLAIECGHEEAISSLETLYAQLNHETIAKQDWRVWKYAPMRPPPDEVAFSLEERVPISEISYNLAPLEGSRCCLTFVVSPAIYRRCLRSLRSLGEAKKVLMVLVKRCLGDYLTLKYIGKIELQASNCEESGIPALVRESLSGLETLYESVSSLCEYPTCFLCSTPEYQCPLKLSGGHHYCLYCIYDRKRYGISVRAPKPCPRVDWGPHKIPHGFVMSQLPPELADSYRVYRNGRPGRATQSTYELICEIWEKETRESEKVERNIKREPIPLDSSGELTPAVPSVSVVVPDKNKVESKKSQRQRKKMPRRIANIS